MLASRQSKGTERQKQNPSLTHELIGMRWRQVLSSRLGPASAKDASRRVCVCVGQPNGGQTPETSCPMCNVCGICCSLLHLCSEPTCKCVGGWTNTSASCVQLAMIGRWSSQQMYTNR